MKEVKLNNYNNYVVENRKSHKISLLIKYIRYVVIFKYIKTLFGHLANQTKHKIIPIKDFESCQELNETI